jgi:AAA family ATP:ADP antiporter
VSTRPKELPGLAPLARLFNDIQPQEARAVALAFACNFMLLASYYILRPVRDAMATVLGAEQLPYLFSGTLLFTLLCAPLYAWLTDTFRLSRVLPGVFWFWVGNILLFHALFGARPGSHWLAAAYFWWFSVVNLFMISVFWSLMVDLFAPGQAMRLFAVIAGGGSTGAIAGPALTHLLVDVVGVRGMLLVAAAGFVVVILLVHLLMLEKRRLQGAHQEVQVSTLDHHLGGTAWDGFRALFRSAYALNQAAFMLLMTWVATIAYFMQTDIVAGAFTGIEARTRALADIDLVVNLCSAVVLIFGLGRFIGRFGVTAALLLNPLLMVIAFLAFALSPGLLMLQGLQVVRRVSQYAIARPGREICFTVVPQESRYKTKNVIDTVIYRLGDLSAAWVQAGLRAAGLGGGGALGLGLLVSCLWGLVSLGLGRRYEALRKAAAAAAHER